MGRRILTCFVLGIALCYSAIAKNHQGGSVEDSRGELELREACLKMRDPRENPKCWEFFPPVRLDAVPKSSSTIRFCDGVQSGAVRKCDCTPNKIDISCTFKLCGYEKGSYAGPSLPEFAHSVSEHLDEWSGHLVIVKFVGFADGTAWAAKKQPKPQPLSEFVRRCLDNSVQDNVRKMERLSERDRLDAELAILRGCALEPLVAELIPDFRLEPGPEYSFAARQIDVTNSDARAAELQLTVANACWRLNS